MGLSLLIPDFWGGLLREILCRSADTRGPSKTVKGGRSLEVADGAISGQRLLHTEPS